MRRVEEFVESSRTERKNAPQVTSDKQAVDDSSSRGAVIDFVIHKRSSVGFTEGMSVVPVTVGAVELCVDELEWWRPITDLGFPGYGEAVDPKAVTDRRAVGHFNRDRRHDAES